MRALVAEMVRWAKQVAEVEVDIYKRHTLRSLPNSLSTLAQVAQPTPPANPLASAPDPRPQPRMAEVLRPDSVADLAGPLPAGT